MKNIRFSLGLLAAGAALGLVAAGCASHAKDNQTLSQQKASVLGGPAPASEKANIVALQAANAQRATQAQSSRPPGQQAPK